MAWKPLNLRQMEVLQWIADGCPNGVMSDFTYKTTAVALRNRHLVSVSKRGGWHAEITAGGSRPSRRWRVSSTGGCANSYAKCATDNAASSVEA